MRKFRNSAIAIVSAAAISLGGITAASAQEDAPEAPPAISDEETADTDPGVVEMVRENGSSIPGYGRDLNADEEGYGTDAFGSSRDDSGEEVPRWLRAWEKAFDVISVGSVLGLVVFPIVNFLKYNGIIK